MRNELCTLVIFAIGIPILLIYEAIHKVSTYYKFSAVIFSIICLQLYGRYVEFYSLSTFLNLMWFEIAWWVLMGIGIICFVLIFPVMADVETEESVRKGEDKEIYNARLMINEFGDDPIRGLLTVYPCAAALIFSIQYGQLWPSIFIGAIMLFHIAVKYKHSASIACIINAEARKGTTK